MKKLLIALLTCVTIAAYAQDMSMPMPKDEMNKLSYMLGSWTSKDTYYAPTAKTSSSTANIVRALGDRYIEYNVRGKTADDKDFEGKLLLTYDPQAKEYVGNWFDSMTCMGMTLKGQFEGDTLTMTGPMSMPGVEDSEMKLTIKNEAKDKVMTTLEMKKDDAWSKTMESEMVRK